MQLGWGGGDPRCGTFQKAPSRGWVEGTSRQALRTSGGSHAGEGNEAAPRTCSFLLFQNPRCVSLTYSCMTKTKWPCPQPLNIKEHWLNSDNRRGGRGQRGYLKDKGEIAQTADQSQDSNRSQPGELRFESQAGHLKPQASFPNWSSVFSLLKGG